VILFSASHIGLLFVKLLYFLFFVRDFVI
jgi:hypothetical protein